jgi:hypothetical protein
LDEVCGGGVRHARLSTVRGARAADNVLIGIIFTAVSIARSFTLRRVFEAVRVGRAKAQMPAPT